MSLVNKLIKVLREQGKTKQDIQQDFQEIAKGNIDLETYVSDLDIHVGFVALLMLEDAIVEGLYDLREVA